MIRFSSFGDIVQAQAAAAAFREQFPGARVDWLVRRDFRGLLDSNPAIEQVIAFDRREGILNLVKLSWRLGAEPYSHIYDAHHNLRSLIVLTLIVIKRLLMISDRSFPKITRRSKDRIRRLLFFKLKMRGALPMPFKGIESYLRPLFKWRAGHQVPSAPQFFIDAEATTQTTQLLQDFTPDIALVPSAAWEMKRWPILHWQKLIELLPEFRFAVLGGPEDSFCQQLQNAAPDRVRNLAGQLSLQGSAAVLQKARLTISGDTGLLHVADQLGRPTLALIGPTAFGYPAHPNSETLETTLPCKPCSKDGRGNCVNPIYQKCMLDITPELVADRARRKLRGETTL